MDSAFPAILAGLARLAGPVDQEGPAASAARFRASRAPGVAWLAAHLPASAELRPALAALAEDLAVDLGAVAGPLGPAAQAEAAALGAGAKLLRDAEACSPCLGWRDWRASVQTGFASA